MNLSYLLDWRYQFYSMMVEKYEVLVKEARTDYEREVREDALKHYTRVLNEIG